MPAPRQTFSPAGRLGDTRQTTQPSRLWLITPDRHHCQRPQSARTARTPRHVRNSADSLDTSSSVYSSSRSSSQAAKGDSGRNKDRSGAHPERSHGRWGGDGADVGAPSGHGWAKEFKHTERHRNFDAMAGTELKRSKSLDPRGPKWPETPRKEKGKMSDKISGTACKAPPGYAGHAPGAHTETLGCTYHRGNKVAAQELNKYRTGGAPNHVPDARWIHKWDSGGYSPGCEIPGYQGFMPGVYSGSLMSSCQPRAAKTGWSPRRDGSTAPLIIMSADNDLRN